MRVVYVENSRLYESGDVFEIVGWDQGDALRIIKLRNWCTAQFGARDGLNPRWKFNTDQDPYFFWFSSEHDGFLFRMRWC